ncbi:MULTISPECIES: LysR family transcriptional regulator [unclassified Tatumella]|uniref:LysR family transcriptional regulator n=1 Tax=unclassified Tatumella TaxID=2649542 RepID=UPI001BAEE4A2|nr:MULTISPECIES: LysR family transcriptional regulator [unclassified Tatumella]MBS0878953.1 LysR family transcriptional regulator [Tatumella sp. JGM82]MBS0891151.1 LysR family transcriptional regulator [Tatumella sp. JGM94]MBS0903187.1 LysR family transcriptional regulator [Tatumella sp. JGM100]
MDLNLQKYKAFISVVEYGSFTRAAEKIYYSQSGISRMINDLEKEWNLTLFERSRSGVTLTADGRHLLPFARSLCESYRTLQNEVDALNGLESGTVRIGTFSSVAIHWLPEVLRTFQLHFPGIDFELIPGDYNETETRISEGTVDCGFIRLPARNPLKTLFLQRDDYLLILPENHPLCENGAVPLARICDYPFLLLEKGNNNEITHIFGQYDLKLRVRYTLWDDYAVMAMVEKGLGISLLPRLILQNIPYRIRTTETIPRTSRDIGLAFRDSPTLSRATGKFIEFLQQHTPEIFSLK